MSYCVNCGVKLAGSEQSCPLCETPVQNPESPWKEPPSRPYPRQVEKVINGVDRRFAFYLSALLLLIPVVIPVIADMWVNGAVTWSVYVIGAGFVLLVAVLVPLLFKKPRPYLFWLLDSAVTAGYIALVAYASGNFLWYLPLGLPISGAVSVAAVFCIAALSTRMALLHKVASVWFIAGLFTVALDYIIAGFVGSDNPIRWSFFVVLSSSVAAAALLLLERHKRVKDEVRRRLFY